MGIASRAICHTCKTICGLGGALSDIKADDNGVLPTPTECRRLVSYHDRWSDPYAFKGTIKLIKDHFLRFAIWRERHNNHRVQLLRQTDPWPKGLEDYKNEEL